MYELNRHKKSDAIKWGVVTVVILLIIATIVVGVGSSWFTNWDTATWFGREPKQEQTDPPDKNNPPVIDGNGDAMDNDKVYPMPETMSFSPLLYNANTETYSTSYVTVRATIEPANATNKGVNWSIAFENPASSWATGKSVTSYMEIDVIDKNCTVKCKAAFGEKIILTAASAENPDIKATCTVDYVKPITGVSLSVKAVGSEVTNDYESGALLAFSPVNNDENNSFGFYLNVTEGEGTMHQGFDFTAGISVNRKQVFDVEQMVRDNIVEKYAVYNFENSGSVENPVYCNLNNTFLNAMFGKIKDESRFVTTINGLGSGAFNLIFEVTPEYGEKSFNTFLLTLDMSKMHISVTGITLDNGSLIIDSTFAGGSGGDI